MDCILGVIWNPGYTQKAILFYPVLRLTPYLTFRKIHTQDYGSFSDFTMLVLSEEGHVACK